MRSLHHAALVAAAMGLALSGGLAQRGILEAEPRQTFKERSAHGDGKKKRKALRRYRVEMEHGAGRTRAARRNRDFGRPAVGNCGPECGNRRRK